ncbi:LamG domain-containing protein [Candidatus Poribacteria bacterium]
MLRGTLFLIFSAFYIVVIASPGSALVDPGSIVGAWLGDEGDGDVVADASGNGYDGTIAGEVEWTDGQFGKALEFAGVAGSRVEIPHDDALSLAEWTITAWAKLPTAPARWTVILVKDPANGVQTYALDMNAAGMVFAEVTSGGGWSDCGSTTSVTDDEWHFLAASYDGAILRIYVDGNMEKEQNFGAGDANTAPVTIGDRMDSTQALVGIVDDVGLFNTALSEADLDDIMNNGLSNALGLAAVEPDSKLATTWGQLK